MLYIHSVAAFDFHSQVREHVEMGNFYWMFSHTDLLDSLMPATPHEIPISSEKNSHQASQTQNNTRCCQPYKAGDWHIKEWLLRTGDPTDVTWMSHRAGHFSRSLLGRYFSNSHVHKGHLDSLSIYRL